MRLEGRSALVTGGASGIGAATTRRLAAEGARVVVADLDPEGARSVSGEVDGHHVAMDVTDNASVVAGIAEAIDAVGPLDVLVNNAGGGTRAPTFFVHTDEAEWTDGLRRHPWSVLAVTHAVLPATEERGSAAIVTGFTKGIAREGAHEVVRANAVAPGPIKTPLLEHMVDTGDLGTRLRQGMIDSTLMRRPGTPDEVAATIAFLACDDASFITGQTIGVSGGLSLS